MRAPILVKLLAAFGLVVALMTGVGVLALGQIGSDHAHLAWIADRVVPLTRAVGDVSATMNEYRKDQLHYIVAAPADRPFGVPGSISQDLAGDLAAMHNDLATAGRLISGDDDRRMLAAFQTSFARYVAITAPFRVLADRGRLADAAAVVGAGPGDRAYDRLKSLIVDINADMVADANASANASYQSYDLGRTLLIALLLCAVVVSVGVAIVLSRRITRAVHRVGAGAKAIACGDIAGRIGLDTRDELGAMARDFDRMVDYLTGVTGVARAIAQGDLSIDVQPRSERDVLGTSLAVMTRNLRDLVSEKERLIEQIPGVVMVFDVEPGGSRRFTFVSPQSENLLGIEPSRFLQDPQLFAHHLHPDDRPLVAAAIREPSAGDGEPLPAEFRFIRPDGREVWLREEAAYVPTAAAGHHVQAVLFDTTAAKLDALERDRLEVDLRLAQKLEAVGQLAAGVAHEINTPIQFIGDSVTFLKEAADELLTLTAFYRELLHSDEAIDQDERRRRAQAAEDASDLDYLTERVPPAFARALDGIDRVSTIVRAMRQFAHPSSQRGPLDVNEGLQTTLVVATNEYKYVADIALDLDELPPVMANASDLNQVFLNLIVNAAHAIESRVQGTGERGTISVASRCTEAGVLVTIADTGCGIPTEIAGRVFDPFFTTKPVGRGTGQGLAIAHTIVVERHHGAINFEPNESGGTTFRIQLPLDDPEAGGPDERPAADGVLVTAPRL